MEPRPPFARVDFHLHSRASNVTDYYAANLFSIPESWSEPTVLYDLLKKRGMSLVTLTDHNSIDGVKELLDKGYADVFISSELTVTFPEDGCRVHLTVANVTEAQFAEADRLRGNVYELIAWLDAQAATEGPGDQPIAWFMTHPLMSTQNRPYGRDGALRVEHLEKMLLLCNSFEVQNGARTRALNGLTAEMLAAVDRPTIERLAHRHRIEPRGTAPWVKGVVAGSDDHAGINPGRTWTLFPFPGDAPTPADLVRAIRRRDTGAEGAHGGPITLAHAILKLLHDGAEQKAQAGTATTVRFGGSTQALLRLAFSTEDEHPLDRIVARMRWWISATRQRFSGRPDTFEARLDAAMRTLVHDSGFRAQLTALPTTDDRIFAVIRSLANALFQSYLEDLQVAARGNLVQAVKTFVALVSSNLFVSLPYLMSFLQQSSDCLIAKDVRRNFAIAAPRKLVLLTDTFFEINGVTGTIRRMIREAERRGQDFTVVTCIAERDAGRIVADPEVAGWIARGRVKVFASVGSVDFPEYDGLSVHFPPLLDVLQYLQEGGFTKMQISTPGTVGLLGLLCAKILQMETSSTYHTSFPEYVENYTRDLSLEALAWNYMIVFYHAVDEVVVPSKYVAHLLHKRGLRNRKLLILDRWVDTARFHPGRRSTGFWTERGVPEGHVRFIHVGRLGVEKNLSLLAESFRLVHAEHPQVHLILVGDGPYRRELEQRLEGLPVTFTGFLEGDALVTALASADVKLFPSTTDTWGNAPLEAQAAGLPVVVSNIGGPCELMRDEVTGFVVNGHEPRALAAAMIRMLDEELRLEMGLAARRFTEVNVVPQPFTAILDADGYRASIKEGAHPSRALVVLPAAGDDAVPMYEGVA